MRIELGGLIFAEFENPSSEVIGLAFAIVILILAFGSVLAMGLPVGVALFGIGIGTSLVILVSNLVTLPETSQFIGLMIGLGVGIDYALLIVTRYREQLHVGQSVRAVDRHRDGHGGSLGAVRRHDRRDLAARHAGDGRRRSSPAWPSVRRWSSRSRWSPSLTLLPALLGFAGTTSSGRAGGA